MIRLYTFSDALLWVIRKNINFLFYTLFFFYQIGIHPEEQSPLIV